MIEPERGVHRESEPGNFDSVEHRSSAQSQVEGRLLTPSGYAPVAHPDYQSWVGESLTADLRRYRVPRYLYHYTSRVTAQKIVETATLRATGIAFLNDHEEYLVGLEMCSRVARTLLGGRHRALVEKVIEGLQVAFRNEVFIASTSSSPWVARNWQKYGERGEGCAIVLEDSRLTDLAGVRILPVEYDECVQEARVAEAIARWRRNIVRSCRAGFEFANTAHARSVLLGIELFYLCCSFKRREPWSPELEWRIVYNSAEIINPAPLGTDSRGRRFASIPLSRFYHGSKSAFAALIAGPNQSRWDSMMLRKLAVSVTPEIRLLVCGMSAQDWFRASRSRAAL